MIVSKIICAIVLTCTAVAQPARWEVVDSTISTTPTVGYLSIACADDEHCVAVGKEFPSSHDLIKRTTDGGDSWSLVYDEFVDWSGQFRDIAHPTRNLIIAVGDSGILRSSDAGSTWRRIETATTLKLTKIDMLNESEGTVVGPYLFGTLRTTNGGVSWSLLPTPDSLMTFVGVSNPAPGVVFALMQQRLDTITRPTRAYRSEDGGRTYVELGTLTTAGDIAFGFRDVDFVDATTGFAFGYRLFGEFIEESTNVIARTTNGGQTWQNVLDTLDEQRPGGLITGAFADRNNGVAVGIDATILRTTDGGTSWIRDIVPVNRSEVANLWGVAFPSLKRAFAACVARGQLLRLERGNSGWHEGNIATSTMTITIEDGWLVVRCTKDAIRLVTLLDVSGKNVTAVESGWAAPSNMLRVNLAGITQGVYFVRVTTTEGVVVRPFTNVR